MLHRSVFGISGPAPAAELTTLDGGRLFLVRPDSIKGSRECIFIDASLSIRKTTHANMYQLVVTRAFQEGEEQLLEEDAENSDERSFLLDSGLFLSLGPSLDPSSAASDAQTPSSFTWLDPDGDGPDDEFEFILPQDGTVSDAQAREFEKLCWRCMWERREGRDWPTDDRSIRDAERTLEADFKVERALPAPAPSFYPTVTSAASTVDSPVTSHTPAKAPLFRASSPSDDEVSDDGRAPREGRTTTLADSDEDEVASDGEGGDSGDELAAQLMQKATIDDRATPSTSNLNRQGKLTTNASKQDIATPLAKPPTAAVPASSASEEKKPLLSVVASLHLYDRMTGLFMLQDDSVRASLYKLDPTEGSGHWLLVESNKTNGGVWVSQGIDKEMVINFAEKELSMVFNFSADSPATEDDQTETTSSETFTWLLRLPDENGFSQLQSKVSEALFEDKWGSGSWNKLKDDEREYSRKAYLEEDAEMWEGDDEQSPVHEDESEPESEEDEEEEEEEPVAQKDSDEESDSEDERAVPRRPSKYTAIGAKKRAKNSALAVGYKDDLSFVVQGDMIGVFKQQREGGKKLKFVTSIVNLTAPGSSGKSFTPGKVMLHNQDTSMILQNPLSPGSLYRLDLETGKVVDEYKVSEDFSIKNFIPDSKFAQTTQQQTFIGHSHNGLFRIDPRLAGSKLVDSEFKQYATKAEFSAAATTESGRLAVASAKGDIRLFDKLGKNAKTALPALGDPILGIDVSADGRYVLATCKTYLLLIDTMIPESSGSKYGGQLGFDRSFPAAQKPTPRRLQLRPEHVAHMRQVCGQDVSFTPAKFNAALSGEPERTIVTSTGPFIVAWNFRQVRSGNIANYTLRRFSEDVVADNFKFGGDRDIIVTLPENVFIEQKKGLKAPSRDSIANVVRTWEG
ncbi:Vid27p [Sporobolomyces koalae]|uniref:Vid27p n=1 Tax=Sporobolomyces koalae TaxID=500713 RepID=UPI003182A89D